LPDVVAEERGVDVGREEPRVYVVGFLFGLVTLGFATCLLLDCGLLDHLPLGQLGQSLPQPET